MKNKTAKRAYKAYLRSFRKAPYDPSNPPQRDMRDGQARRVMRMFIEDRLRGAPKRLGKSYLAPGLYHMSILDTLTAANGFTLIGKP